MCFAPQRRALFWHLNFQKWSEPLVFCTFWLVNVLRATTACNFSSLLWPAGSAPAALASLLFDPLYLLSSYSFSSDLLSSNLPLLSASALLCFSSLHIVGSLTSKLPSNIYIYTLNGGYKPPSNHWAVTTLHFFTVRLVWPVGLSSWGRGLTLDIDPPLGSWDDSDTKQYYKVVSYKYHTP